MIVSASRVVCLRLRGGARFGKKVDGCIAVDPDLRLALAITAATSPAL